MFRKHLTYANVVATLALFLEAVSGGAAYAAIHYLITSTKQIKPSVLSALKGKVGPAGTAGAPGANGSNGSPGEKGAQGEKGPQGNPGSNGSNGSNGKSVISSEEAKGGHCAEGGSNFEVEGSGKKTYACDGDTGFTETLPPGETETGTWGYTGPGTGGTQNVPISFPIPLHEGIEKGHVEVISEGGSGGPDCTGGKR